MQPTTRAFRACSSIYSSAAPRSWIPSPTTATSRRHFRSRRDPNTSLFALPAPNTHLPTQFYPSSKPSQRPSTVQRVHPLSTTSVKMSYSNTDTGSKPADPYKAKNKDEPSLKEKIEGLDTFIKSCKFGMMTTKSSDQDLLVSRCMAVAAQEAGGIDLIFHTNTESGKTDDLDEDSSVNMAFLDSAGSWASVSGKASIITDRDIVKKYYSPALKTWLGDLEDGVHDGSENDPRIGVIKVSAKTATYAVSISNPISRGIEMVQGAITGNAAKVNKLREISEAEISQWRSQN